MEKIQTSAAPSPIAPYSQGVRSGDLVYVSGQGPTDPDTRELQSMDVREQTRQVMENIRAVLEEAGINFDNVVESTIYIADMANYEAVNEVYSEYFSEPFPARAVVEVSALPGEDYHLEIRVRAEAA